MSDPINPSTYKSSFGWELRHVQRWYWMTPQMYNAFKYCVRDKDDEYEQYQKALWECDDWLKQPAYVQKICYIEMNAMDGAPDIREFAIEYADTPKHIMRALQHLMIVQGLPLPEYNEAVKELRDAIKTELLAMDEEQDQWLSRNI